MGSLTACLRKAGDYLHPDDKSAILARAGELRAGGAKAPEAARQAVLEQRENVKGLLGDNALTDRRADDRDLGPRHEGDETISTRQPTSVKADKQATLDRRLNVGMGVVDHDPVLQQKHAEMIRHDPLLGPDNTGSDKEVIERFINKLKDNLLYVYRNVPKDVIARSRHWYWGANTVAGRIAEAGRISRRAASAVLAAMSPQTDWDRNVSQAGRLVHTWQNHQDTAATPQMAQWFRDQIGLKTTEPHDKVKLARLAKAINGKTLREVDDSGVQAWWIRAYDEAHNDRSYHLVSPEGNAVQLMRNTPTPRQERLGQEGDPATLGWGSSKNMAKAIEILKNDSVQNISESLGRDHKVRSFYNNIIDPDSKDPHVTIDTHAVAAARLEPLSGDSPEVKQAWGGVGSSDIHGQRGLYGEYAEAYRRAADEVGLSAREMQSVTWEAVRGLFDADWKRKESQSAEAENRPTGPRQVWDQHAAGTHSAELARDLIVGLTPRGFVRPNWDRANRQVAEGAGPADHGREPYVHDVRDQQAAEGRLADDGNIHGREAEPEADLRTDTPEFRGWFGNSKVVDANGKPKVMYHGTARDIASFIAKKAGAIFLAPKPTTAEGYSTASREYIASHQFDALTPEQRTAAYAAARDRIHEEYGNSPVRQGLLREVAAAEREGREPTGEARDYFRESSDQHAATGENIMPLYVKAERPFDYENPEQVEAVIDQVFDKTQTHTQGDGQKALVLDGKKTLYTRGVLREAFKKGEWNLIEDPDIQAGIRAAGHDGFYVDEGGEKNLAVYDPTQVKSATGNSGRYDPNDPRISGAPDRFADHDPTNPAALHDLSRLPKERLEAMLDQVYEAHTRGELTFDQMHERTRPLHEAIVAATKREDAAAPVRGLSEVHPGFTTIPNGTRVLASHGTSVDHQKGTVVGQRVVRVGREMYSLPRVKFGDDVGNFAGEPRTLQPDNIHEVYAPRGIANDDPRIKGARKPPKPPADEPHEPEEPEEIPEEAHLPEEPAHEEPAAEEPAPKKTRKRKPPTVEQAEEIAKTAPPVDAPPAKDMEQPVPNGTGTPQPRKPLTTPGAKLVDWLKGVRDDLLFKFDPMSMGNDFARAAAKMYANAERRARWEWRRFDDILRTNYNEAQRKLMWEAADEENTLRQQGQEVGPDQGLNRLDKGQRDTMEELHRYGEQLMERARAIGMFEGESLPFWTPRMAVMIGEDGVFYRPEEKGEKRGASDVGRNFRTSTPNLRQRRHVTAEESEAAMKGLLGENAELVRDIRAMPIAMARLERAIAGRELVNSIKELGAATGVELVNEHGGDKRQWFTIDHPAFKTYGPRFERDADGKMVPILKEDGTPIIDAKPLYMAMPFKGPLHAVLSGHDGFAYRALMAIKAKSMSIIMYSPLIHQGVEWGRALPMLPGKVLTFRVYGDGARALADPKQMREALDSGFVPLGDRGFMQDISGILNEPNLKPGRSWTSQVLGAPVGLVHKGAGDAVKGFVDKAGDFWHGTLLWNQIAKLQMGLYVNLRAENIRHGMDEKSAGILAAHWGNRFAGALPREAMSEMTRKAANFTMFSRSFSLGNMGAMKDALNGMPSDIKSQILMNSGEAVLKDAVSRGRRKAQGAMLMDIGFMYAGVQLMQAIFSILLDDKKHLLSGKDWGDIGRGYLERLQSLSKRFDANPWEVATSPLRSWDSLMQSSENEPKYIDRVHVGRQSDGRELYMRLPTGKIGEDMKNWMTSTRATALNKLAPIVKPIQQVMSNDDGLGHKVFDPEYEGIGGAAKNLGRIAKLFFEAQGPTSAIEGGIEWAKGTATAADKLKVIGPLFGVTFSQGNPGGKAVGEEQAAKDRADTKTQFIMPDVLRALKDKDEDKAIQILQTIPGMTEKRMKSIIDRYQNPESRDTAQKQRAFNKIATPEEIERMERIRRQQDEE